MRYSIILISLLWMTACSLFEKKYSAEEIKETSQKVNEFLDRRFDAAVSRNPEFSANLGIKTDYDKWTDRSEVFDNRELAEMSITVDSLKLFPQAALDEQTKLSIRLYEAELANAKEDSLWRNYYYSITQMGGEHNDIPSFLINIHKIDNEKDANDYIARLKGISKVFEQVLTRLKKQEELGIVAPKFTFDYVSNDVKTMIEGLEKSDEGNILLTDFIQKIKAANLSQEIQNKLLQEAAIILKTNVKQAYQGFYNYWIMFATKQTASNGIWSLPNGEAYYQYRLKRSTTTNKTPEEVYQLGLSEVARIQDEMRAIMKKVSFKSDSLQVFFEFMRTSPQFKYTNDNKGRAELLGESNSYIRSFKKNYLPLLFANEPRAALVVMEVEKFRAKSAGGAFYENPAEDGSRPGRFYVNTYNMDDEPRYQMEALCYHEGLPGHHMQIAIAQELQGIPKFRKYGGNTAYIEGWGLYSELIPKEVGLYQDPYSDFGRLSMEIFRAARLVVDAAIHTKKWTREQAIEYFVKNTANAKGDIEKEIERYFLWPGQATGYKIGMIKILELRTKAKNALGDKFDIKKFHSVILENGSVPLDVLEELVDKYIAETKTH